MKPKRKPLLPLLFVVVVAGGLFALLRSGGEDGDGGDAIEGAVVRRGALRISVVERGNLKAADSVELKSEVAGSTTILYLIEEGSEVHAGDLLCELDTSALVDRKVQQEIKVQNALATYTKAQQSYEIQISQNTSDIARGERDVEFAGLDLRKYQEGEKPQELQSADEDILLRTEELQRAEQSLSWSEKLADKGFLEQTQLDADRLAKSRAEVALAQSKRAKELLVDYTVPRRVKELEAGVAESRRELDRIGLQAKARLADYDANLKTSKAKYELEESELAKLIDQIEKAHMVAPVDGMVVYSMEDRGRYGGGQPIQEGTSVRERQGIITIPSEEGFLAEASLHESVIEKVIPGMACLVTVDALGKTVRGEVQFKAVLPDQQSWWANPDLRVYRTQIEILDPSPRMRPGMSCSIEILVDDLDEVLFVPVQSVFLDGGAPVALVSKGGAIEKRPVTVGQNNGKWVEIQSGLEEGETVLLSVPAGITLAPTEESGMRDRSGMDGQGAARTESGGHGGGGTTSHTEGAAAARGEHAEAGSAGASPSADSADSAETKAERFARWKAENPEAAKRMMEGAGASGGDDSKPALGSGHGAPRPGAGAEGRTESN